MTLDILKLIGRNNELFTNDKSNWNGVLSNIINSSNFLVIGGAGTIGQAVVKEIFSRNPRKLHVVDINENNLVELVRDIRSSFGYISGEFKTFCFNAGGYIYNNYFTTNNDFDYILNLSALKHVRSEKDPYTLMRLINTNITNVNISVRLAIDHNVKKYFCVSTDKAANPVNMMGASKRIMELFLLKHSQDIKISMARFANVAFSDGSLLHGFDQRLKKNQPLSAPSDIRRYFVTHKESGILCLFSSLLGDNMDTYFPKLNESLNLSTFSDIAVKYLESLGLEPFVCESEEEARSMFSQLRPKNKYPCYFFESDTTGEKDVEEFYTLNETIDLDRYSDIGVIKNSYINHANADLKTFEEKLSALTKTTWSKGELVKLFEDLLPDFNHQEKGKFLDQKM